MPRFILNSVPQQHGDHEVHELDAGCPKLPRLENQIGLGEHLSCHAALAEAKHLYPRHRINGCSHCAAAAHIARPLRVRAFLASRSAPVKKDRPQQSQPL